MPRQAGRPGQPGSVFRVARRSTVDLIAAELRNAIFSGALPVGSALGEVEISSQLGVSRSPLREATQRLVQEGLLTATPGRGLRVTRIGPDDVPDVYTARSAVEGHAVRLIAERPGRRPVGTLVGALAVLERVSAGEDARAIGDADLAFHQAVVDAAGSIRLSRAMETLVIETRIATFSMADGYAVRRSVSPTYQELIDALESGDVTAAIGALDLQFSDAVARLTGTSGEVDTVEPTPGAPAPTFEPIDPSAST